MSDRWFVHGHLHACAALPGAVAVQRRLRAGAAVGRACHAPRLAVHLASTRHLTTGPPRAIFARALSRSSFLTALNASETSPRSPLVVPDRVRLRQESRKVARPPLLLLASSVQLRQLPLPRLRTAGRLVCRYRGGGGADRRVFGAAGGELRGAVVPVRPGGDALRPAWARPALHLAGTSRGGSAGGGAASRGGGGTPPLPRGGVPIDCSVRKILAVSTSRRRMLQREGSE